ncbi:hypothetical protein F3Y22_tig00110236pilonHSYRG00073 [Hibiscus syriacus]|uniref:Uncharacterized protein n=1 Tax=Hibiscus syriacus TaxID=106335 RepID=A0A6A3B8N3_HIBSY|nr:hypothetical protein F3Y22_tig00110236pilonHSYRG00073 [Hibiscus syriacus]
MESQEPKAIDSTLTPSMYSNGVMLKMKTFLESSDGDMGLFGKTVVVGGWVKSCKFHITIS